MWDKIKQVPAIISIIMALFQAIKDLVLMVEEEGPENGGGEAKKNLVLSIVEIVYDMVDYWIDMIFEKDVVMTVASRMIEIVVNFFNIVNVFKKKDDNEEEEEEEDYKAKVVIESDGKSSKFRDRMELR